jgi:deoxyribose-phosphate aldolase
MDLAPLIDHTALKPDTTESEIEQLCTDAHKNQFAAVCVMPAWVPLAREILDELESPVKPATTIGFPLGAHRTVVKVAETIVAINDGAREVDMVMNVGALKSNRTAVVLEDITAVVLAAHEHDVLVKVILETALLTEEQKRIACEMAVRGGADFVKTSTGFSSGGATIDDIRLMRTVVPPSVRVKASGGIRDRATALAMVAAGADRIGTSSGIAIINGD